MDLHWLTWRAFFMCMWSVCSECKCTLMWLFCLDTILLQAPDLFDVKVNYITVVKSRGKERILFVLTSLCLDRDEFSSHCFHDLVVTFFCVLLCLDMCRNWSRMMMPIPYTIGWWHTTGLVKWHPHPTPLRARAPQVQLVPLALSLLVGPPTPGSRSE